MVRALVGLLFLCACGPEDVEVDDELAEATSALFAGENGDACAASAYNCKLRVSGGNRVQTNDPSDTDSWAITAGGVLRNGNGDVLGVDSHSRLTFNFGQVREFGGEKHALALSTSNGSSAWFPISHIAGSDSFLGKVGHVSAHSPPNATKLGCYEIKSTFDASIELKKVVKDSKQTHERAGDYLPLIRNNGVPSANLTFNVPGFALGGVTVDHFPAGTKFQRLDVPTTSGAPSIDIPLWVDDGRGRYLKQSGEMKFIYGYVIAKTGTKRVGWMAYEALKTSSACP